VQPHRQNFEASLSLFLINLYLLEHLASITESRELLKFCSIEIRSNLTLAKFLRFFWGMIPSNFFTQKTATRIAKYGCLTNSKKDSAK